MEIAIAGHSGFVGTYLKEYLLKKGYSLSLISRTDIYNEEAFLAKSNKCEVFIDLVGASINKRWTNKYRKELYSSRVETNRLFVSYLEKTNIKQYISASAVGIYDTVHEHDENSTKLADDFLSQILKDKEALIMSVAAKGIKPVVLRFGVVLGKNGGALSKMLPIFKLGLGGKIASGKQAFPFIHIQDLIMGVEYIIKKNSSGVYNFTAPQIIDNRQFTKALASTIKVPAIMPVPGFALKLLFGEGATVLTSGQKVNPRRLLDEDFKFQYPTIEKTLTNIL